MKPTKEIRMIGLDLDGTILNNNKEMSPRCQRAIEEAARKGVIVLPATGRPLIGIPEEILRLEGVRYAVSANGAVVYDLVENKKLHEDCMDLETVLSLLIKLQETETMADVFIDGIGYVEREVFASNLQYAESEQMREYLKKTRIAVDNLPQFVEKRGQTVQKMTVNFRMMEDGSLFGKEEVLKILEPYSQLAVVSGMATNLEITKKTATKGNGLLALGKILGIERENIMACGDSGNDREMLRTVGFGVAMANATADVLEVADYVTVSNEEDGVAYVIEQFVLEDSIEHENK